jgi:hypothetical protein
VGWKPALLDFERFTLASIDVARREAAANLMVALEITTGDGKCPALHSSQ